MATAEPTSELASTLDLTPKPEIRALSIVVPTRNEGGNVAELVRRIDESLREVDAEILFVDDSDDDTPVIIEDVAARSTRSVRLIHRTGAARTGGLGGAILAGFRTVEAPWAVVMDGDLQHPPSAIPELMSAAEEPGVDLVVASRYADSGDASGLSSAWRVLVSSVFTVVAKLFFPWRLRTVSDPMSGFFAVRLDAIELDALRPAGYKILLEIVARSHLRRAAQVPFTFQERLAGESKASAREAYLFIRQLVRLRLAASMVSLRRVAGFLVVGASGIVVNTTVLALLLSSTAIPYQTAAVVGAHVAIVWNYLLLRLWVFDVPSSGSILSGLVRFWLLNVLLLPVQIGLLALFVSGFGAQVVPANIAVLVIVFGVRYLASSVWVFRPEPRGSAHPVDLREGRAIDTASRDGLRGPESGVER